MKEVIWIGTTQRRLCRFEEPAKRSLAKQIWRLQNGEKPEDWRPMSTIGIGANEIRIHYPGAYRVIYVASYPEGIYLIHAFQKKTKKTPSLEIDLARKNYSRMRNQRKNV